MYLYVYMYVCLHVYVHMYMYACMYPCGCPDRGATRGNGIGIQTARTASPDWLLLWGGTRPGSRRRATIILRVNLMKPDTRAIRGKSTKQSSKLMKKLWRKRRALFTLCMRDVVVK